MALGRMGAADDTLAQCVSKLLNGDGVWQVLPDTLRHCGSGTVDGEFRDVVPRSFQSIEDGFSCSYGGCPGCPSTYGVALGPEHTEGELECSSQLYTLPSDFTSGVDRPLPLIRQPIAGSVDTEQKRGRHMTRNKVFVLLLIGDSVDRRTVETMCHARGPENAGAHNVNKFLREHGPSVRAKTVNYRLKVWNPHAPQGVKDFMCTIDLMAEHMSNGSQSGSTAKLVVANIFFPGVAREGPYHHSAQYRDVPELVKTFLKHQMAHWTQESATHMHPGVRLMVSIASNFWDVGRVNVVNRAAIDRWHEIVSHQGRKILKQWRSDAILLTERVREVLPSSALLVWRTANPVHPRAREISESFYRAYNLQPPTTDHWNWKENANAMIKSFNEEARQLLQEDLQHVWLVDFERMLSSLDPEAFLYDYIHPNAPTTYALVEAMLNALLLHYRTVSGMFH
eukprot:scaffold1383_cov360-Prasinococcus_capsulatus_cf.AAC.13